MVSCVSHRTLLLSGLEKKQRIHFSIAGTFQSSVKSHHPCFLLLTSDHLLVFHADQEHFLHCFGMDKYTTSIAPGGSGSTTSLLITAMDEHPPSPLLGTKCHPPQQQGASVQLHKSLLHHESQMPPNKREPTALLILPIHHAHTLCHMFLTLAHQRAHPELRFSIL